MFKTIQKIYTHIREVQRAIGWVTEELTRRAIAHDGSKWSKEEFEYYVQYEKLPEGLEFGSDAYKAALKELNIGTGTPGFEIHSSRNDHHPEYYTCRGDTVAGDMLLFPLIEMVCDWHGAHIAYGNSGDWWESVKYNVSRFDFSQEQTWAIFQVAAYLEGRQAGEARREREALRRVDG